MVYDGHFKLKLFLSINILKDIYGYQRTYNGDSEGIDRYISLFSFMDLKLEFVQVKFYKVYFLSY